MRRLRIVFILATALLLGGCSAFFGECSSTSSTGVFEYLEGTGCSGNFSNWSGSWTMGLSPYAQSHPIFDRIELFFGGAMQTGARGSGSVVLMNDDLSGTTVGYFDYEVLEFNAGTSERLIEGTVRLRIEHLEADFGSDGHGTFQATIETIVIRL